MKKVMSINMAKKIVEEIQSSSLSFEYHRFSDVVLVERTGFETIVIQDNNKFELYPAQKAYIKSENSYFKQLEIELDLLGYHGYDNPIGKTFIYEGMPAYVIELSVLNFTKPIIVADFMYDIKLSDGTMICLKSQEIWNSLKEVA